MKKTSIISIIVLLIMLSSCSSPKADMYIEDGVYNLTAQEYIDRMNDAVEVQGDSRYLPIPDFEESEDTIDIDFIYLTVRLTTNDAGNIAEIYYTWDGTREDVGYSLGLYLACTLDMLGVNDTDAVYDQLDMMNYNSSSYETSYEDNGTSFSYRTMGSGQFNYLTISPSEV